MSSLWGEEFVIPKTQPKAKKVLEKVAKPKVVKEKVEKVVKSKSISDEEKVAIVTSEVYRILGHYKDDTQVIRSYEDLVSYIDAAIKNGVIAIDTETNNSLEPITCKLMGGCIYTPG